MLYSYDTPGASRFVYKIFILAMKSKILVEQRDSITTIIINRSEVRNALDREATSAMAAAVLAFENDAGSRVAVLCGSDGTFCSGADLKELAAGPEYNAWAGHEGFLSRPATKPVIAAVAGHACAGGLGLALWCDLRIAEVNASFAVLSRRWGVPMSDGTTVRLPRIVGAGRALEMLLTARIVAAPEALQMGLVTAVVPEGTARDAAERLARKIADFPQIAMRSDRQSAYSQIGQTENQALKVEAELAETAKRAEAQDGARRFAAGEGRHGALI